jgi:hypothetical protein
VARNPYHRQPERSFWRSAVAQVDPDQISDLWQPKFRILKKDAIVTAGSCFAQHIGAALSAHDFNWIDSEPAPMTAARLKPRPDIMSEADRRALNYGVFSFRTGNIYTSTALAQWVGWVLGQGRMGKEIWQQDGRFFDPFRPTIEPGGYGSEEELLAARQSTVDAMARTLKECDVFVFTLGLTERWINKATGVEYPMCPGTAAGTFRPAEHVFDNLDHARARQAMVAAIERIRKINPTCRFLLTVSPVPLTATASGKHVLVATTYSKSILRSVAGGIARDLDYVDYFPSYEIISSFPYRGQSYAENMRSVTSEGVALVMRHFFSALGHEVGEPKTAPKKPGAPAGPSDEELCDEALLDAFGPGKQ